MLLESHLLSAPWLLSPRRHRKWSRGAAPRVIPQRRRRSADIGTLTALGAIGGPVSLVPYARSILAMPSGPVAVKFSPLDDEVRLTWNRTSRSMYMVGDLHSMTALGGPPEFEREMDESQSLALLERGPVSLLTVTLDGGPLTCEKFTIAAMDFVFSADQVAIPLVLAAPAGTAESWPEFISAPYDPMSSELPVATPG